MIQTNQDYKYQLDKSSRKCICPRCGKKTFVLYLDDAGQSLSDDVGRCDRQDKCKYHYAPNEYFKDRKAIGDMTDRKKASSKRSRPKQIPPDYISPEVFASTLKGYECNSLMIFLHSVFDGLIGADEVNRVAMQYGVGTSKMFGGSPVFWQIDSFGKIRTGKVMGYNRATGKRVKEPKNEFQWVHAMKELKEQRPDFRLQQCYFGSHRLIAVEKQFRQLNQERKALYLDEVTPAVALFESEKACLIVAMALAWGGMDNLFIPVSCGGCEGFNPTDDKKRDLFDGIRLLKNRRVVIFPDEGKFNEWMRKAQALKGFSEEVYISTLMERGLHPHTVECEYKPGDAIDDLILGYIRDGQGGREVADLIITSYGYKNQYKIV
ncbi:MAG: hypothetical protein K2K98_04150 [Muribaculaceae bacterium]|nr:hypothetical protein [Muribaculaceae bacterium]